MIIGGNRCRHQQRLEIIMRKHFLTAAIAAITAMSAFGAAEAANLKAPTPKPRPGAFAANPGGGDARGHTETCNNIASCNLMISYCASHGGDWTETGTPGPEGQPQKGQCTYP